MISRRPLRRAVWTASLLTAAFAAHPAFAQTAPDTAAPPVQPPLAVAPIAPAEPPLAPETVSAPPAQEAPRAAPRFRIGPEVGVYLPTDSKTRDRFGSSWVSIGLGFGGIDTVKSQGQIGFDIALQYQKHNGNRIFLLPVGLGYRVALTKDTTTKTIPYAGLTADLVLADIRSVPDNVHSGIRTGVGGSALIGVNFGSNANLEVRYQLTSRIKSFDFSGLSLSAGYRF